MQTYHPDNTRGDNPHVLYNFSEQLNARLDTVTVEFLYRIQKKAKLSERIRLAKSEQEKATLATLVEAQDVLIQRFWGHMVEITKQIYLIQIQG